MPAVNRWWLLVVLLRSCVRFCLKWLTVAVRSSTFEGQPCMSTAESVSIERRERATVSRRRRRRISPLDRRTAVQIDRKPTRKFNQGQGPSVATGLLLLVSRLYSGRWNWTETLGILLPLLLLLRLRIHALLQSAMIFLWRGRLRRRGSAETLLPLRKATGKKRRRRRRTRRRRVRNVRSKGCSI